MIPQLKNLLKTYSGRFFPGVFVSQELVPILIHGIETLQMFAFPDFTRKVFEMMKIMSCQNKSRKEIYCVSC